MKFTTNEGMGFIGRGEGIAALAVATVERVGLMDPDRPRLRRARAPGRARPLRRGHLARADRALPGADRAHRSRAERLPHRHARAGAGRRRPGRRAPRRPATSAPLLGVPVAVKDNTDVAGEVTTHGTGCFTEPAARRLRGGAPPARGGRGDPRQDQPARAGDHRRSPSRPTGASRATRGTPSAPTGGSSGGSGAAVAAGLCATAHASDGAGSIRIPAANCGLVGMKPQRGRVSLMPDAQHWHGMSVAGALTRTVADQALMLDVLSGPAEGDAHTPAASATPVRRGGRRGPGQAARRALLQAGVPGPDRRGGARGGGLARGRAPLARPRGHRGGSRLQRVRQRRACRAT